jgi:hypothetical protein
MFLLTNLLVGYVWMVFSYNVPPPNTSKQASLTLVQLQKPIFAYDNKNYKYALSLPPSLGIILSNRVYGA